MAFPAGYNPLRWDCKKDGCFNTERRPHIELFADCFPRNISFGDVDGLVELNSYFCILEWKGDGGSLRKGQRLTYVAFTQQRPGNVVFVVSGSPKLMTVNSYCTFWHGVQSRAAAASLNEIKARIKAWADWAQQNPLADAAE